MNAKNLTRGALIAAKRKALQLTQQQVADAAKITQQSYAAIELDQIQQPKRTILKAISKMLDIPLETLIINDSTVTNLTEGAVQVAREYDRLTKSGKLIVMQAILQARGMSMADDPVSERSAET